MPKICLVLIAGLDRSLHQKSPTLPTLASLKHQSPYRPVLPAVTSTMQATLTTGSTPADHGIICNGLYTHNRPELLPHLDLANHADVRKQVSFWEQSNSLLQRPRFWTGLNKKTAMLFWQNSMPSPAGPAAADIVITPKPHHTSDGKTLTACWSNPADLYSALVAKLGPFPLHNYWSPMAGLPSSQWIARAAEHVWQHHQPDLQLVYIPHLDFNLLRLGPTHPAILKDLADLDTLLAPLAAAVRADGGTFIIAGDYGMSDITRVATPNLALRHAGLLQTKPDPAGKLLVDYENSTAFAMVDHQIAHIYLGQDTNSPAWKRPAEVAALLRALPGIAHVLETPAEIAAAGLANPRSGNLIALASPDTWLAHDWWLSDAEKPPWQFTVDIHSKPGFDTRELFFDREKKCIAQNPTLPKGSHALVDDPKKWPMLLSDTALPKAANGEISATAVAAWLQQILAS